ncbi:carbohydrate ABC transporter permease [Sphaerotilus natans]|jgi:trehalose/maltose transport system permease protein|uniref:Binding-protein-dependent transport system inner membrane protein n=1 Tax=Sphaerotilus natans subsp. natans DSM 6575 TaxID=1286631 RepID=A0A059KQP0_9BURK|nr:MULTISPECIES: sugar ABC transporter permease [Sphaerotilus]KDB53756.1 binding-protein-dependent transport system inner membrane protein [Sphaerotilus natans subsp. natans DSM 6575]GKQ58664.1 sugar ABC transporter permease [Sphaerotilus sp. FB-3]SIQ92284.1 carbohydrate ABC transporter membrane protein 1, CUT1 family [Sphaerotilus natans]
MSSKTRTAWLFLAPMLVTLLIVAAWPLGRTIWFSFTDANLNDMGAARFVGLENYFGEYGLFANPNHTEGFWLSDWGISILNTLQFSLVSVLLETMFGLGVALLLNQEFKGRALVRAAVLVPWAIPTIVSAKMWGWMLHDQFGVINAILQGWGLIDAKVAWTADPQYALWTVVVVDVWKTTPFMALLILAALQTLPKDCYEAAHVDGVHPLRVFWSVTLPLIRPALMVAVIFRLLDALRVFDLIYVLTSNNNSTMSMSGFVRREMVDNGYMGYGSAASTALFLIIGLATVVYMRLGRMKLSEDA